MLRLLPWIRRRGSPLKLNINLTNKHERAGTSGVHDNAHDNDDNQRDHNVAGTTGTVDLGDHEIDSGRKEGGTEG
jgi:hypothetical protein